jgi:hypothetical protein
MNEWQRDEKLGLVLAYRSAVGRDLCGCRVGPLVGVVVVVFVVVVGLFVDLVFLFAALFLVERVYFSFDYFRRVVAPLDQGRF